jgi:hypothetical protein
MNKYLSTSVLGLIWFLLGIGDLQARVVISQEKQIEILQTARLILGTTSESDSFDPESLNDPFHIDIVKEPVAEVVEAIRELTDSEILALASKQLKPSGFIDQGGHQYLILNGKKVKDGVSFNFPHQQKRYAIEINQIQTNSFTLNLNSESKTISME